MAHLGFSIFASLPCFVDDLGLLIRGFMSSKKVAQFLFHPLCLQIKLYWTATSGPEQLILQLRIIKLIWSSLHKLIQLGRIYSMHRRHNLSLANIAQFAQVVGPL